jgi:hypothetical protein
MTTLRATSLVWAIVACLSLAPAAFAANATESGYQTVAGDVQSQVPEQPAAVPATDTGNASNENNGSNLPFTGFDVAIVALIGTGLVGIGFGVRRLSRRPAA